MCDEPNEAVPPPLFGGLPRANPVGADAVLDALPPELKDLREQIRRVAPQETTVLLVGKTGTGKTRLARLIHDLSPRRDAPFLVVDCGALSESLIESEMFGHVKGAFTGADRHRLGKFAAAGAGTLLLDEINSLALPLQSKLLRAIDERVIEPVGSNQPRPVKARLIVACNVDLEREIAGGRFRSDLYYRLNVVSFYLPGLGDRRAAIAPLARKFLAEFAARNRPDIQGMSPRALRALEGHNWPGNIRELRNVIERAVALAPGPDIDLDDLPEVFRGAVSLPVPTERPEVVRGENGTSVAGPLAPADKRTLAQANEEAEIAQIIEALRRHNNNKLRAAADLGISRVAFYKKLHKYRLFRNE